MAKQDSNILYDRSKLLIMTTLIANQKQISYMALQEATQLTKGNMTSHLHKLETEGYIKIEKEFVGRKPLTTISLTAAGKTALKGHIEKLKDLIQKMKV